MARVNETDVREIITLPSDMSITALINASSIIVDTNLGSTYSETILTEIEKWLSAHLISCSLSRQANSETISGVSISYNSNSLTGLNGTTYGAQVLLFDTQNILSKLYKPKASIKTFTVV